MCTQVIEWIFANLARIGYIHHQKKVPKTQMAEVNAGIGDVERSTVKPDLIATEILALRSNSLRNQRHRDSI